jgi:hypothetical protein
MQISFIDDRDGEEFISLVGNLLPELIFGRPASELLAGAHLESPESDAADPPIIPGQLWRSRCPGNEYLALVRRVIRRGEVSYVEFEDRHNFTIQEVPQDWFLRDFDLYGSSDPEDALSQ